MASGLSSDGMAHLNDDDHTSKVKLPITYRIKIGFTKLMKSARIFLYNKENQTVCGNTSSAWMKISIYYVLFYICSGLFYSGMVAVFAAILSRQSPRYTYKNSQMSDHGEFYIGMGFRPMPEVDTTLIGVYNDSESQNSTVSSLTNYRLQFLTQYDLAYVDQCTPYNPASSLAPSHSCKFSWTDIVTSESHPCSTTNLYGWPNGQPCMLIKLNKVYGWIPAAGNVTDQVANATGHPVLLVDEREQNIYITCTVNEQVNTNISNMVYYSALHPLGNPYYGGIPYYFFPYLNTQEHVQPFVLVQFTSLPLDQTVNVACRAWAPNIVQLSEGTTLRGMTKFDLIRSKNSAPPTK